MPAATTIGATHNTAMTVARRESPSGFKSRRRAALLSFLRDGAVDFGKSRFFFGGCLERAAIYDHRALGVYYRYRSQIHRCSGWLDHPHPRKLREICAAEGHNLFRLPYYQLLYLVVRRRGSKAWESGLSFATASFQLACLQADTNFVSFVVDEVNASLFQNFLNLEHRGEVPFHHAFALLNTLQRRQADFCGIGKLSLAPA